MRKIPWEEPEKLVYLDFILPPYILAIKCLVSEIVKEAYFNSALISGFTDDSRMKRDQKCVREEVGYISILQVNILSKLKAEVYSM